ncbi:hypothetical protein SpiGrapes_2050 [Sphaerochaeta pleomorpha str. Grapes]|uniref:Uncharacterized protein n=1 Tax=Sphaerochaeta pleomorpha (strain ATCC BAA-1885 / DSM 22778 / Grapes) TaxID=158190 RepID=G8QQY9_SPHPG|nr:hypothetical protein [Sphaerochaeta pleomorpha]AEV29837.1 hypothetical protein SpiGrapes_2050 [Sphaerochaeta pleomorpha str. Grapes]
MEAAWILVVIFSFVIIISAINNRHELKKKKLDAALRMQEMSQGIKPGTYSSLRRRDRRRERKHTEGTADEGDGTGAWEKENNRAQLKKGIDDLQKRLDNIETIMNSRKGTSYGDNE